MKPAAALLGLILLLDTTFAAEQSCVGRCGAFDRMKKCQCDSLCVYYDSCCDDFATLCPKRARGDTFEEEEYVTEAMTTVVPTVAPTFLPSPSEETTQPTDPDVAPCSGRPFDAFLQLKNGSIYAFRGEYFFELDDTSILPGYPKLIQDVWGITGPIDAAFTRVNCQGKSYIFKGNQYWRFDGDVMDEDYPRNISVGFADIPNGIDAAFAVPASSHRGKEKAYFFKGDRFYLYEFKHQPSHAECVEMTRSSPSVPFLQYADLFCDQSWDDFFSEIFGDAFNIEPIGPRLISEHWSGLRAPVDAAILGRAQVSPKPTVASPRPVKRRPGRRRRPRRRGKGGRYRRHALFDDLFGSDDWFDSFTDLQEPKSTPAQKVYFFKGDKYYRVNLQTQRVDFSNPPYPRPIAKYWLGCKHEEKPDISKAEKR